MSSTVSMMQLLHFFQLHVSGKFHQFDHGKENLARYDSPHPPEYKLHNVTAPIHLYSASEDALIPPEDVEYLKTKLPNAKNHEIIEDWNHADVVLGKNAKEILYKNILKSMNSRD
jgi:pimeloyl-ACP methyl ester carboxylesterase